MHVPEIQLLCRRLLPPPPGEHVGEHEAHSIACKGEATTKRGAVPLAHSSSTDCTTDCAVVSSWLNARVSSELSDVGAEAGGLGVKGGAAALIGGIGLGEPDGALLGGIGG